MPNDFTEVSVTFETITPLWTGDAWMENRTIRPSSILGSLRFWFEIYRKLNNNEDLKLNEKNVPNEKVDYKALNKVLKDFVVSGNFKEKNVSQIIDEEFDKQKITVGSRLFGCTNWRSRITILDIQYKRRELAIFEIKKDYLVNAEFWINKSLYNEKHKLLFWENITFNLIVEDYWFELYLKGFLECLNNQIILVGGKKSFGFGITKILTPGLDEGVKCQRILNSEEIFINDEKARDDFILGFNFRHFLRRNYTENKFHRIVNFGKQEKATKIYISNKSTGDNKIWFIYINNPFDDEYIPPKTLNIYKNALKQNANGTTSGNI